MALCKSRMNEILSEYNRLLFKDAWYGPLSAAESDRLATVKNIVYNYYWGLPPIDFNRHII